MSEAYQVPGPGPLREFLRSHSLTGAAVAQLVGVSPRTVRKWTADEGASNATVMPWSTWALVRILVGDATRESILAEAGAANRD